MGVEDREGKRWKGSKRSGGQECVERKEKGRVDRYWERKREKEK